jgi:uncharacterized protein
MGEVPSVELLESTHTFPGPYMFKAIGKGENGFVARVVAAVRDELACPDDPPYKFREAVGGRHISVTLTPTVQTGKQVLAVYARLRKVAGLVLMM